MMKRRILAIILAGALVLALAACGEKGDGGSNPADGSVPDVPVMSGGSPASDGVQPDAPSPEGPLPVGGADASEPSLGAESSASNPAGADIELTLNRTSIELNKAGATFKLRYTVDPDIYDGVAVFTSSNAKVASVDESGTIKAVAPGKATITVKYDSAVATASVNCNWEAESDKPVGSHPVVILPGDPPAPAGDPPAPAGKPSTPADEPPAPADGPSTPAGDASAPADEPSTPADEPLTPGNVDLSAFYSTITGKYTFAALEMADDGILDMFYEGMTGISTEQRLIYICAMSMNTGEFGLVQVKDGKDVDAVKKIFQARIDAQAGGGAWYPQAVDNWMNNSRVVSNGNYVMMVVHESCDDIVKEFHALF